MKRSIGVCCALLTATAIVSACRSTGGDDETLAQDTSLSRDLGMGPAEDSGQVAPSPGRDSSPSDPLRIDSAAALDPIGAISPPVDSTFLDVYRRSPVAARIKKMDTVGKNQPFYTVRVFYGTNRGVAKIVNPVARYSSDIGDLEFGTVLVSVPVAVHQAGEIERPFSILGIQITRENRSKHFVVLRIEARSKTDWLGLARSRVRESERGHALVYIHGFLNGFDDAAYRTAQLGIDLGMRREALFMFSWPSKNALNEYMADEETVRSSVTDLREFLTAVLDSTQASRVSIIAHSMGTRLLTAVLREFAANPPSHMPAEIILAAPDISAEEFKREIAPRILSPSYRISVYTARKDRALQSSKRMHSYLRLGEGGPRVFQLEGFDKIDASEVDLDLLGHGYYAQTAKVLKDLAAVVRDGWDPKRRGLTAYGRYKSTWMLTRDLVCSGSLFEQGKVGVSCTDPLQD